MALKTLNKCIVIYTTEQQLQLKRLLHLQCNSLLAKCSSLNLNLIKISRHNSAVAAVAVAAPPPIPFPNRKVENGVSISKLNGQLNMN